MAHGVVTATTLYVSGFLQRRLSPRTRLLLKKVAGILLTAIAVSLILRGVPELVVDTLKEIHKR
jgi:multiple antibiotic resistance protein